MKKILKDKKFERIGHTSMPLWIAQSDSLD